ncbi:MAG TPA: hypothetical protein VG649_17685 [Candidatus Angelobacter sp.]|nr:hypothetical protein [Candidatus Angelobacter sp.]
MQPPGSEQAAEILGLSQKAVDKRRRQGRVIGLSQGHRGYVYPAWQFENGNMLPHLEKVLDVLRRHDPWMQMEFFLNGNDRLSGESPLDALRKGHVASVLRAASGFGEHGTA